MTIFIIKSIIITVPLFISVAYFILAERKIRVPIKGCSSFNALIQVGVALFQFLVNLFMKKGTSSKPFHDTIFVFAPLFIFFITFDDRG